MAQWLYVLLHLIIEAGAGRRDARIRFLNARVENRRRKLGGNRVIPSPDHRARLLAIGAEFNHDIADLIGIVTASTFSRWVVEQREGREPKSVGRPKVVRDVCEHVMRIAPECARWGDPLPVISRRPVAARRTRYGLNHDFALESKSVLRALGIDRVECACAPIALGRCCCGRIRAWRVPVSLEHQLPARRSGSPPTF